MKHLDNVLNNLFILCEDNHLLCVYKPAGLLTQPDQTHKKDLQTMMKNYLKKKYRKKSAFLSPIHRLDKDVGGIVVFAKTSKALSRLNEQMRHQKVIRKYYAIVEGKVRPKQGRLVHYLLKQPHKSKVVEKDTPYAKKAELVYKVIKYETKTTHLSIQLITGRYHQIRCQLSAIGHPIIGDKKYGSHTQEKNIKLCNIEISVRHPVTEKKMTFFAPI